MARGSFPRTSSGASLYDYFKFVLFSSDFGYKKPDHRIFLAGAERLGLRPDEISYVGDSQANDLIPSRQSGMKSMHMKDAWRFFICSLIFSNSKDNRTGGR